MTITKSETNKKYKEKRKLTDKNKKMYDNDILHGSKKLVGSKNLLLGENIKLTNNGSAIRYKNHIQNLMIENFNDAKRCFFLTFSYKYGKYVDMHENFKNIEKFLDYLKISVPLESLVVIPEYNNTHTGVHNHGIIKLLPGSKFAVINIIKGHWNNCFKGSMKIENLETDRNFGQYISKYIDQKQIRLYHSCDSTITHGIDLNGIKEARLDGPRLTSIGNKKPRQEDSISISEEAVNEETIDDTNDSITDLKKSDNKLNKEDGVIGIIKNIGFDNYNALTNSDINNFDIQKQTFYFMFCALLIMVAYHYIL